MAVSFRSSRPLLLLGSLLLCASAAFAGSPPRPVATRIAPTYPELAKRMHVAGTVVLLVTVQPNGAVSNTKVESGHPLLTVAAEDAVRRWRFVPGPDSFVSEIEVHFRSDAQ